MPPKKNTSKTRLSTKTKTIQREKLPEVGGILHFEHINFEVLEHDSATVFFMNGLGLTRDPFRRADETNMGVNIGMQQFHLPRRGNVTPPFDGEVGLVIPDRAKTRFRLERLAERGKFDGTPFRIKAGKHSDVVVSPYGFRLRLHQAGTIPFPKPLGLAYMDFMVAPGKANGIAQFYRELFKAPVEVTKMGQDKTAIVTVGPHQTLRFRERKNANHNLYSHHIAVYVSNYNEIRDRVVAQGSLDGEGRGQVFFFGEIFNPRTGKKIIDFNHEVRSVYHPEFMRPLVNRWPIVAEPYQDQSDFMMTIADAGFVPEAV